MRQKTLAELIAEKDTLPLPQLYDLVQRVKALAAEYGVSVTNTCDTPIDFADKYSPTNEADITRCKHARHADLLGDKLAALENKKAPVPRLMVSMPPRFGKSTLISMWFPIWLLARNPKRNIILASYEFEFAASWGERVRNWIRENGDKFGLRLDPTTTAKHNWKLTSGGGMMTAGAGGPLTGKGADVLIIDDPIKNDEEANSEVMREKMWSWWQSTASTRIQPGGFCVVVATRWHEDDLLGRLERDSIPNPETGERAGLEWDILKLPALCDSLDDPLGRKIGEWLWPERFPPETMELTKKGKSPYIWSALYQQVPTPEEGNAIKRTWWKFYDSLPINSVNQIDFDVMIQSWDLAFFDMKKSDYCVGQVWGRKGASMYLVDQVRDHLNARDVIRAIKHFQSKYPKCGAKIIEDRANGPAVIQMLAKELPGMIPVKAKGTKDQRLQSILPYIEAGNVHIPRPEVKPWAGELIEECAAFPRGTHDDMVDALVHALRYLQPQAWAFEGDIVREAKRDPGTQNPVEAFNKQFHAYHKKEVKKTERRINQGSGVFNQRSSRMAKW